MNTFYEHHKDSIRFGYRCFDRILLNGLIQPFQQPERVVGFFNTYRHLYPVSRDILRSAAEQFQLWVNEQAKRWNARIIEAPKGRRDEFVEPYFREAKPDQIVVILKAREPARIMTAIGDKKIGRWHLQIADRWMCNTTSMSTTNAGAGCSCACAPIFRSPLGFVSTSITGWRTACAKRVSISSNAQMHLFAAAHPSASSSSPTP
jgi:hypothetical protein